MIILRFVDFINIYIPLARVHVTAEGLSVTRALQAEPQASISVARSTPLESGNADSELKVADVARPPFRRTYVNTLLISPQQKKNFSHSKLLCHW